MVRGTPLALLLLLPGCGPKLFEEQLEGMRHVWTQVNAGRSGTAKVRIPVNPGETALLATAAVTPPHQVHVRRLEDPLGAQVFNAFDWWGSDYSKSNAAFVADTVSLNWPIMTGDPTLAPGRWLFELAVVDEAERYTSGPIELDVFFKADPAFDEGRLAISIVYVDGLEGDDGLREAVDEAKEQWRELYAQIGVDATFSDYAYDVEELGPPALGEEQAYVEIAEETPVRSVNLVVSERIEGFSEIFGIAGDIPGPLTPTARSGVQINASMAAGPDGEFDPEDVRLLAETMAHEVLHFLGLYHPVESDWAAWDALGDTPECGSETECTEVLGENLMFPYPVCSFTGCAPQDDLTDDQGAVANRYVGVE